MDFAKLFLFCDLPTFQLEKRRIPGQLKGSFLAWGDKQTISKLSPLDSKVTHFVFLF